MMSNFGLPQVVVAIPEQQHSFELVSSLRRNGINTIYITTVYFKNNSLLLSALKYILPQDTYKRAAKHHCKGIEDENVVVMLPVLAMIQLIFQRISIKWYRKISKLKWKLFGNKLVDYLKKHKPDVLILYEDYSAYVIEQLAKSKIDNLKIIIDCCAASKTYMKEIYENDDFGQHINDFIREYPILWDEKENIIQFQDVSYILVPSEFSKKSYLKIGVKDKNIMKIGYPLHIDINKPVIKIDKTKLRFVYSGQITFRKGIHHLLEAFLMLSKNYNIELYLYGVFDKHSSLFLTYSHYSNIHFIGYVLKEKMLQDFSNADVFVFPSLADSMSFSCLEAMACGLPVICTSNTGAADYITNYVSGIVIPASSTQALVEAMEWCLNNKEELNKMGLRASNDVNQYISRKKYDESILHLITSLFSINK